MILIDTHVLVWWSNGSKNLSKKAFFEIEKAKKDRQICVSSISFWEIALLVKSKRLEFSSGFENWHTYLEKLAFFRFIPVDNRIAIDSVNLPDFSTKDLADRIIVSTAINLPAKLITNDKRILKYPSVQAIW